MVKNQTITAACDGLGYNGEGIIHFNGATVFVPFVLPGEEVTFKVLKVKKNIAYGRLESILKPSPDRVEPKCGVFHKCGGCQLQHMNYSAQLSFKKQMVENCFSKIAGLNVSVGEVFASPDVFSYRNKLQLPTRCIRGENKIGFFRENSHDVVPIETCPIQPRWADCVISCVLEYINVTGVTLYNDETKKGLLRHVVVRSQNNEFLFTFVVNGDALPKINTLTQILQKHFESFSVIINVNKKDNNVILGDVFKLAYGNGKINLNEFGVSYQIGAESFYQVNTKVKKKIYQDVLDLVWKCGDNCVIDAFSGAGVMTAMLAKVSKKCYGVEIVKEACDTAEKLAKDNGIDNIQVICGDCENILPSLIENLVKQGEKVTLVFDPPRSGVDRKTLEKVLESNIENIIYISCSPQTLARDIGILMGSLKIEDNGIINLSKDFSPKYDVKTLSIYDMFAQTKHVETVVCLKRKSR